MTRRSFLPYAALVVALAVLVSFGGFAAAKAKVIGKNLVVTKSIKKGAVTGDKIADGAVDGTKVKDGSLGAADLAPGTLPTIPAPSNGKAAVFSATTSFNAGMNGENKFSPTSSVNLPYGSVAPTALSVADLRVNTDLAVGTFSISLRTAPNFAAPPTTVLTCTATGAAGCTSAQSGVIPAGNVFWLVVTNVGSPPVATYVAVAYTMKVQ